MSARLHEFFDYTGQVKTRTLAKLTDGPPAQLDALRRVLHGALLVAPADAFEIVRSLPHGHVAAVLGPVRQGQTLVHVQDAGPVRVHVQPLQRRQRAQGREGPPPWPCGLCQPLLDHDGVDLHQADLEEMEREHTHLLGLAGIARELAALTLEEQCVGPVPVCHHGEPRVARAPAGLHPHVIPQNEGFHRTPHLLERLGGGVAGMVARKAPQDGFGVRDASPQRHGALHPFVILVRDQGPMARPGEHGV